MENFIILLMIQRNDIDFTKIRKKTPIIDEIIRIIKSRIHRSIALQVFTKHLLVNGCNGDSFLLWSSFAIDFILLFVFFFILLHTAFFLPLLQLTRTFVTRTRHPSRGNCVTPALCSVVQYLSPRWPYQVTFIL